jgi:hypothetical protein
MVGWDDYMDATEMKVRTWRQRGRGRRWCMSTVGCVDGFLSV